MPGAWGSLESRECRAWLEVSGSGGFLEVLQ